MSGEAGAPLGLDLTRPNIARVYDYLLGGKDHFPIDREAGDRIRERIPGVKAGITEQRALLRRVVLYLVGEAGLRQLIDIGTGLPTAENVHQITGQAAPGTKVAYVDNDPVVLVHARALLATDDDTIVVDGDLREPAKLLADSTLNAHIDLSRPVGLLMCGLLHHVPDSDDPWARVAELVDALPSGSYLFVHHLLDTGDEQARSLNELGRSRYRSLAEIERFFTGLELVEPGIVSPVDWRPDPDLVGLPKNPSFRLAVAGVARKP